MDKINFDSVATFPNGDRLVVSTQHSGGDSFTCELFEASQDAKAHWDFRMVSNHFEASTCLAAQTIAFQYAKRLYPAQGIEMKQPPYLIWVGPGIQSRVFS